MSPNVVEILGAELVGPAKFHDTFSRVFGFPAFYGRNMDAWIDCMSCLRHPNEGMSTMNIDPTQTLTILIQDHETLRVDAPKEWRALLECSGFVNKRAIDEGRAPILALAF